jgi:Fe-S-cluster containining protein
MSKNTGLDCSEFVPSDCKAYCCGPVPVSKPVYFNNLDRRCRPVVEEIDMGDMVFPQTGQNQCVFLSDNFHCQIYEDRPKTCREFGKIDSPLMQCPFMDKCGNRRTPKERKNVEKEFDKALKIATDPK